MMGQDTSTHRTAAQTATAKFWTANAIRQDNRIVRDITDARSLGPARHGAAGGDGQRDGADAGISVLNAKYHYLFWRPVDRDRPHLGDGRRLRPGPGLHRWQPGDGRADGLAPARRHAEPPRVPRGARHDHVVPREVLTQFLGTSKINIDIHGFDANGAAGNLDAVHHFAKANDLRREIIGARLWAGLHYRFSSEAGIDLGRSVAKYDLKHAFQPVP